jgi:glutamine synthetase adenylyltransferase
LETSSWTDALCALPAPLQAPTERLLERFQAACALTGAAPPVASLPQVFALSPFCAEVAIAQPAQWLATLAMPGETREPAAYAERCAALFTGPADETRLRARVRQFRNLELAAIMPPPRGFIRICARALAARSPPTARRCRWSSWRWASWAGAS